MARVALETIPKNTLIEGQRVFLRGDGKWCTFIDGGQSAEVVRHKSDFGWILKWLA